MVELEDLPSVGEKTAEKLRDAGFADMMRLATATPKELSVKAEIGEGVAEKVIEAARKSENIDFETAFDVLERRKEVGHITVGSQEFNDLIGGGIETQSITEVFGEFGSGKSQISHELAVTVQLPEELGGLDAECVFLDTENTFRPERIEQIANAFELDIDEVLRKIHVARAFNSAHQILMADKVNELIQQGSNIKLVIVDSLMAHFRAEYVGRESLAVRQQKLNQHLHSLQQIVPVFYAADAARDRDRLLRPPHPLRRRGDGHTDGGEGRAPRGQPSLRDEGLDVHSRSLRAVGDQRSPPGGRRPGLEPAGRCGQRAVSGHPRDRRGRLGVPIPGPRAQLLHRRHRSIPRGHDAKNHGRGGKTRGPADIPPGPEFLVSRFHEGGRHHRARPGSHPAAYG